ncbi:TPA: type IV pilus assembly protein FimV, partial [Legionella anisa]
MKKTALFSSLFSLTLPLCAYALGLGEMKVESALNQPFLAEIELIDAHEVSLSNIKVELADPQSYKSLGVERSEAISILFLDIKKNKKGKFVLEVYSKERMTEPYMQLIVDLTWPKGQIFKVYTVLLDPPGYKLTNTIAQSGLTYQRKFTNYHQKTAAATAEVVPSGQKKKAIYGPAASNESIWQIAQRYKTSEAILPQIVLAIVGTNPDAFIDGNLNGLKAGTRLKIPSDKKFLEVPADLATVEVMAHDKAWNEKTSINHVLAPPYITGQASHATPVEYSQIAPAPKFPDAVTSMPNQKLPGFIIPSSIPLLEKQVSTEQSRTLKAEISITTAAVDSLRESNALLTEQLSLLQAQNKKLQKQLDVRDKELQLMRNQIQTLMKERMAIAGQSGSTNISNKSDVFWTLLILLLVAGGGSVAAFYYFKQRDQRKKQSPTATGSSTPIASYPALIQPSTGPKEELVRKEPIEVVKSEL